MISHTLLKLLLTPAALVCAAATFAQVAMDLSLNRTVYMQYEPIYAAVTLRNDSGRALAFGHDPKHSGGVQLHHLAEPDGGFGIECGEIAPRLQKFRRQPGGRFRAAPQTCVKHPVGDAAEVQRHHQLGQPLPAAAAERLRFGQCPPVHRITAMADATVAETGFAGRILAVRPPLRRKHRRAARRREHMRVVDHRDAKPEQRLRRSEAPFQLVEPRRHRVTPAPAP